MEWEFESHIVPPPRMTIENTQKYFVRLCVAPVTDGEGKWLGFRSLKPEIQKGDPFRINITPSIVRIKFDAHMVPECGRGYRDCPPVSTNAGKNKRSLVLRWMGSSPSRIFKFRKTIKEYPGCNFERQG
jgi:hypothetical protein